MTPDLKDKQFISTRLKKTISVILSFAIISGLYLTSLYSYTLFHSLAEVFSIVIACCIFIVAWNTRHLINNNYLLFLGIAYLFIGIIDFIHTLAYKGMGVFIGFSANLPTQLWIAARYMEAISLIVAPLFFKKRLNVYITFIVYLLITSSIFFSIFYLKIFPDCFIEGKGLTLFKIISEYIISSILIGSLALLYMFRERFEKNILNLIMASIVVTIGSELAFTFYISVYGLSNFVGHIFKIISFYLIYMAILQTGLVDPYSLLLKDLKDEESLLKEAQAIAHIGHWVLDVKSGRPKWSEEIFRIFGLDPKGKEPTLEEHRKIIHPEDWEFFIKTIEGSIRNGTPFEMEFRILLPDETVRWLNARGDVKKDKKGDLILFGTAQDITERKKAEEIIRDERKRFATLIDNAPFGLMMVSPEGIPLYVNPKFTELFGYSLQDMPDGKTFFEKAYPEKEYRKQVIEAWKKDIEDSKVGQKRPRIFTLTAKNGIEKVVHFIPVQLATGEHIISCEDITEQRRLEEHLKSMSITDELTGLYNRRGFITLSEQQLKIADMTKKGILLFFIDMDKMKQINDTLGHKIGDIALVETAALLKEVFRESDIIARIGGDEFAALALDATIATRDVLLRRLDNTLYRYNKKQGRLYEISLSVGVAYYDPSEPLTLDELMSLADTMMYEEKRKKA
ncbi:MAG: diguanylate cyclase [Syntrophorhabdaceae bacterium]|nr:diguanylate cyclase [Syntrophorhabdaceae bacterium]